MKKIIIIAFLFGFISDLKSQNISTVPSIQTMINDSLQPNRQLKVSVFNRLLSGIVKFLPDVVGDTSAVSTKHHGMFRFQRADSAVYVYDTIGFKRWRKAGTTSLPISSLTAATGTNTINNGNYLQDWQWNTLSGSNGFKVSSTSTAATGSSQVLFWTQLSGANVNSNQSTYSALFQNTHTGTNSTNYGIDSRVSAGTTNIAGSFSAINGTNNYAIIVPANSGRVGIGTSTPSASSLMELSSTTAGLLIPRMNTTQQNAISTPATGLLIYNTDSATICHYNGSAWLKMGSGGGGTPGGSTKQFQYNNSGAFAGSGMLTQETDQILITGNSAASTPPFEVNGHEDLTGEILNVKQSGTKKFSFHSNGSIEMAKASAPSTPASGYLSIYANYVNSKLYTKNDAGKEAQLIQDLQLVFGAGSGADADTTAFTTSAIYGSFYNDADTIVVTSMRSVLQGTSPDVTYKVWYNDSLNVEAGATALVTAGSQVTNTTTGTNVTSFDVTKIPPGVWVWVKTSTVATKPKYFSLTVNGYRK